MKVALVPPQIDLPRNVTVEYVDDSDATKPQVKFKEISDLSSAEGLVSCHCLVKQSDIDCISDDALELAQAGNQPFNELADFEVVDEEFGHLGKITFIEQRPLQSLLHITSDSGQELLVPLVDEFVINFNEGTKTITLNIPEGLLDL